MTVTVHPPPPAIVFCGNSLNFHKAVKRRAIAPHHGCRRLLCDIPLCGRTDHEIEFHRPRPHLRHSDALGPLLLLLLPGSLPSLVDLGHQRLVRAASPLSGRIGRCVAARKSLPPLAACRADPMTIENHRTSPRPRSLSEPKHLRPASMDHRLTSARPNAVLYLRPPARTGARLQFQTFDAAYIEALCAGDVRVQEHFVGYFTELIGLKVRPRLSSRQAQEDVRQETFARVLTTLRRENGLRQPERLGAFVNTVCNNVLFEHYRSSSRQQSLDGDDQAELPAAGAGVDDVVAARQLKTRVSEILSGLSARDRALLEAIFLEEKDREEVCREMGVDGGYLRVLLFRAKQTFRAEYLRRVGERTGREKV